MCWLSALSTEETEQAPSSFPWGSAAGDHESSAWSRPWASELHTSHTSKHTRILGIASPSVLQTITPSATLTLQTNWLIRDSVLIKVISKCLCQGGLCEWTGAIDSEGCKLKRKTEYIPMINFWIHGLSMLHIHSTYLKTYTVERHSSNWYLNFTLMEYVVLFLRSVRAKSRLFPSVVLVLEEPDLPRSL